MKKILAKPKLPTPSKLVRRILSRTSNVSRTSDEEIKNSQRKTSTSETMNSQPDPTKLELELTSLREQLSILQLAVNSMQEDAEKKEKTLANLARDKQQLSTDLQREKRSSTNLKQQLEDEREFYYKEKEQYCQEMNDCKKLKKKISESAMSKKKDVPKKESTETIEHKNQISKLKEALNKTLEANYSLSVKFLRMRNTKIHLKNLLTKQESEHAQEMQNLQVKINNIKNDIADVVDKRFMLPISPSNKKYLQIIKQNGMLMHENLCLQMEVDHLTAQLEHLKYIQLQNQAKKKLKHAHSTLQHKSEAKESNSKQLTAKLEKGTQSKAQTNSAKHLQKTDSSKTKFKQTPKTSSQGRKKQSNSLDMDVIKIFERKETAGIPEIIMLPQDQGVDKQTQLETENAKSLFEEVSLDIADKQPLETDTKKLLQDSLERLVPSSQNASQIGTECSDCTNTTLSREAIRTQSAPEIVQTSLFVSLHKS